MAKQRKFPLVSLLPLVTLVLVLPALVFATQIRHLIGSFAATTSPVDFEDPNFTTVAMSGLKTSGSLLSVPATTTSTITFPLVFAIEAQTLVKYPDAQTRIQNVVANINSRLSTAGANKQWRIDHFSPVYNKTITTTCQYGDIGVNLPTEFCNHPANYVFVIVDELTANRNFEIGMPSVAWHGYNGLFSSQGISALAHETGHALGLPDEYHVAIQAANNFVNGQAYDPFLGNIMHNLTPGNYSAYDVALINHNLNTLPVYWATWVNYQPANNQIKTMSYANQALANVNIQIYTSDPSKAPGGLIDTTAEYSGLTNSSGIFSMGANPLGNNDWLALKAFLVKATYNNLIYYRWLNFTDVNFAFLNGQTQTAIYTLQIGPTVVVAPTATPTPRPTSTPTPINYCVQRGGYCKTYSSKILSGACGTSAYVSTDPGCPTGTICCHPNSGINQ